MAPEYEDVVLRQSLRETCGHAGGSSSPDLIPWSDAPDPDPQSLGSAASWAIDPGRPLVACVDNYFYVRARNAGSTDRLARLFLGHAPPSIICWPDRLEAVPPSKIAMKAGAIGVGDQAFIYKPSSQGDALAAWAYTQEHPLVLPTLGGVGELLDWLETTPEFAQRSVGFGLSGGEYEYVGDYDQRGTAAQMCFEISYDDCPAGWELSLRSASEGGRIQVGPAVVAGPGGAFSQMILLPERYRDTIRMRIDSRGIAPHDGTKIVATVYLARDEADRVRLGSEGSASLGLAPLGGHGWRAARPP